MSGPNAPLFRLRSTALVGAVAALLTSVGAMTAHADPPGLAGVPPTVSAVVVPH
jgi:hypothetical protein